MRNTVLALTFLIAVFSFAACNGASEYSNANTGNENTAEAPEKDLAASLAGAETKAYGAWQKKDGKYFESFLKDGFVGVSRNGRGTRAGAVKGISENPCEVKGFSTSDEEALELGDGLALLTMKVTSKVLCDGKAEPSPEWAATVYVKDGDQWKAAYHQTVPAPDAKGEFPSSPAGAGDQPGEDGDKEITAALSEITNAGWEAWTKKDTKWFEEHWDEKYFAITGSAGRGDRAARIKSHGEHKCEVKSVSIGGERTTKLSEDVVLFTYKSSIDGTCEGRDMPKTIWGSSIYTKEADSWKSVFYMGTGGAE